MRGSRLVDHSESKERKKTHSDLSVTKTRQRAHIRMFEKVQFKTVIGNTFASFLTYLHLFPPTAIRIVDQFCHCDKAYSLNLMTFASPPSHHGDRFANGVVIGESLNSLCMSSY